jgi:hypothetical protein
MEKQQIVVTSRREAGGKDFFSDRGFCHYRMVIIPDEQVIAQLQQEQEYAVSVFGNKGFPACRRELILASFQAKEEMEETMLRWLYRVVCQENEFIILFNNYGSTPGFPLYVRVQDPTLFRQLANSLKIINGLLEGNECPPVRIAALPRLMLSNRLDEQTEMEVLLDFSARSFRAEMSVKEILLVKNEQEIVSRLRLLPKERRTDELIIVND